MVTYWLQEVNRANELSWHGPVSLSVTPVAPKLSLAQNWPNPLRSGTTFSFGNPMVGDVVLRVVDVSGRVVATLFDAFTPAGSHTVTWNGRDSSGNQVPSGIYFYHLRTTGGSVTRKMVVMR